MGRFGGLKSRRVTVPENQVPKLLQLKLPRSTNAALDGLASKHHRTKSELVRQAIYARSHHDEPLALEARRSRRF